MIPEMKKLFWDDPYRTSNVTTVESVQGRDVTVRESVFFSFSGGQESDSGTIGGISVERAKITANTIVYTLAEDHSLQIDDTVRIVIDWDRRYRLMRLHFAAEIVLWLFMERFPGIERIGAHISEHKARIDFKREEPITSILSATSSDANDVIARNMAITSAFRNQAEESRYWEIVGFGSIPCGGTHIRSTGEVGPIRLSRKNIGKGKERVEIKLIEEDGE
jgi:alanyl-tRNA synthetase